MTLGSGRFGTTTKVWADGKFGYMVSSLAISMTNDQHAFWDNNKPQPHPCHGDIEAFHK